MARSRRRDPTAPREPLKRRWTKDEIRILTTKTGAFAIGVLERDLPGRTRAAIRNKLLELFGGGVTRGTQTLAEVARSTGYSEKQILRASRALGQRIQRSSTIRSPVMFFDDQVESMMIWLRHDYWCRKAHLYACAECGTSETPPRSLGLCRTCFKRRENAFARTGRSFSARTLLAMIADLRPLYGTPEGDWLDAFRESLARSCVLSPGALDRLLAEHQERFPPCSSPKRSST